MLTEWLAFDFVRNALWAMALLAAVYPLLGVFVVGQRVAYFSDAVAHAAFIGAGLAGLLGWRLGDALLLTAPPFALLVAWFQARTRLPTDTLLVVAITGVSGLGIALISLTESPLALGALLFGDVLALESGDLWRLFGVDCLALAMLLGAGAPADSGRLPPRAGTGAGRARAVGGDAVFAGAVAGGGGRDTRRRHPAD
jgi:ABC-type Mn2+/Zn2+ transport system permease subunit